MGYSFSGQHWLEIKQISFGTTTKINKNSHDIFSNDTILDAKTDLNNIFIPGKYTCIDHELAMSCSNIPPTMNWGFTMLVLPQAWDHIIQLLITNKK